MAPTRIHPNAKWVGIVYDTVTGEVRQHVYTEDGEDEERVLHPTTRNLPPGEAICRVDIAHHHAGHDRFHQAIRDAVKAHGGIDAIL